MIPDSYRSNFRPFYLQPPYAFLSFCSLLSPGIGRGIVAPPSRDGFRSWLRHRKAGSPMHLGRIEFNVVVFMDWSFASGCSPPRLSTTQLPSATDRPVFPSDRGLSPYCWCVLSGALLRAVLCPYFELSMMRGQSFKMLPLPVGKRGIEGRRMRKRTIEVILGRFEN